MTELIYKCDGCKKQLDTQEIEIKIIFKDIPDAHYCTKCAAEINAMVDKFVANNMAEVSELPKKKRAGRPKKKDTQPKEKSVSKVSKMPEPLDDMTELDTQNDVDFQIDKLARELAEEN